MPIKRIVFIFFTMIIISSCLSGMYVEKSYTFIDFETENSAWGIRIRDAPDSSDANYTIFFNSGDIRERFFYRLIKGPYSARFNFSNKSEIEKVIVNDIVLETNGNEGSLLKNIKEIKYMYRREESTVISNVETPEKLNEFYTTKTIEFDNLVTNFSIQLRGIKIPYSKVENIIMKYNITVYLKDGQIHTVDKKYTLTRFKRSFWAPYV